MPNCLLWDVTGGLTHGSHSACLIADLFVGTSTEAQYSTSAAGVNLLHRNRGNGYYDEISTTAISELVTDTKGASWGDMDGDGDLDLFVANSNAANEFYRNENQGTSFTRLTGAGITSSADSRCVAWVDLDGDADLDLIVGNYGPLDDGSGNTPGVANEIYRNNGNGAFTAITSCSCTGCICESRHTDQTIALALGDYNGDGLVDVFFAAENTPNLLYRNEGSFNFAITDTIVTRGSTTASFDAAFGDYDGDGDLGARVSSFVHSGSNAGLPAVGCDQKRRPHAWLCIARV